MENFSELKIKQYSRLGQRATLGLALYDMGPKFDDLIVLTSDVSTSAGLQRFKKQYPEKYLDVGIAEQNLIGVAAGLASEGFRVLTTTFAPFQTMRCCEQIKVNLGYMHNKVCMVGLASGLVLGPLGFTHCCIEDLSIMRSIPGITVLSPSDCLETIKAVEAALMHNGPVYIRLTGGSTSPQVYKKNYNFKIGEAIELKEGKDITIFSTGSMVYPSLNVANLLDKIGINASVINIHTIKPLDKEIIKNKSINSKLIVSIEEHSIIGGLGGAIAEYNSSIKNSAEQLMIGVQDTYGKCGSYDFMKDKHGLTEEKILKNILNKYNEQ